MSEETSKSRGELEYGWWKLLLYAGSATGAGMVGGLLGVGGGTIIGPFFLELGMPPEVNRLSSHQLKSLTTYKLVSRSELVAITCSHLCSLVADNIS